jgi:methyl coenzyme M reductase subunit C-like uncharacterized protein (methanogenesis marker protein 7)
MIIALDYDDTYTQDPALWNEIVELIRAKGHDISIVSERNPEDMEDFDVGAWLDIYFTNGMPKREYMSLLENIQVDVWIDDQPEEI